MEKLLKKVNNMKSKFKINNIGTCPLCEEFSLEFGNMMPDESGIWYEWTCEKCGATGKEFYKLEFCTHGNVKDKDGNLIENEYGY